MRPKQWVKNAFVFAPVVFAEAWGDENKLRQAMLATVLFCVLSGAVYILNDIMDVDADKQHPAKKTRPIASGDVPVPLAQITFSLLLLFAFLTAWVFLNLQFVAVASGYLVLNLAYSFGLKKFAYLDVLCIAFGFMLRVLAGSYATSIPLSSILLIVVFCLALYLGLGKRAHELAISKNTRQALLGYNRLGIRIVMGIAAVMTMGGYTQWSLSDLAVQHFGQVVWTVPFVFLGMARFMVLVTKDDPESPTDAMLKDKLFMAIIAAWGVAMVGSYFMKGLPS